MSVLQPGLFRVELPNGHRFVGYVLRREQERMGGAAPGDRVMAEFSPYDLSKGRVRAIQKQTA